MDSENKYNILVVDDNPFPTRECFDVLIDKLCKHFNISDENKRVYQKLLNGIYTDTYNKLTGEYIQARSKWETFFL